MADGQPGPNMQASVMAMPLPHLDPTTVSGVGLDTRWSRDYLMSSREEDLHTEPMAFFSAPADYGLPTSPETITPASLHRRHELQLLPPQYSQPEPPDEGGFEDTRDNKDPGSHIVVRAAFLPSQGPEGLQSHAEFRHDSVHGGLETKINADLQAKNFRAWEKLDAVWARVNHIRLALRDERVKLQHLRRDHSNATSKFEGAANTLMSSMDATALRHLKPYHEEVLFARDALDAAEGDFDELEMRLYDEEQGLKQEEMKLYRHNNISVSQPLGPNLHGPLPPLHTIHRPASAGSDISEESLPEPGLLQQYLIKLARANYLKNKLDHLDDEEENLLDEFQFRKRYNLHMGEEVSAWLADLPEKRDRNLQKLNLVEDELYDLRDQCLDEGLFGEDEHKYEPRGALFYEVMDMMDEAQERIPVHAAIQRSSSVRSHETDFTNIQDFINSWLQKAVQESMVENYRLKLAIEDIYPENPVIELKGDDWADLAIKFWRDDRAGEDANMLYGSAGKEPLDLYFTGDSMVRNAGERFDYYSKEENYAWSLSGTEITEREMVALKASSI